MNLTNITPSDQQVVRRAMEYWVAHWDWECPTLFGISLDELKQVIDAWPTVPQDANSTVALAMLGAMRELLYGASAVPESKLPTIIGVSAERAGMICSEVRKIADPFI